MIDDGMQVDVLLRQRFGINAILLDKQGNYKGQTVDAVAP
jgi:hypothetical protein